MKLVPGWKFGALLGAEVVAAASVLAYANAKSPNTNRGTYAFGANKQTGEGGVDADVALGAGLVVVGAALLLSKYSKYAPHVIASGAGALCTYSAREGDLWERKKLRAQLAPPAPPPPAPPPPPSLFRAPDVRNTDVEGATWAPATDADAAVHYNIK